MDKKFKYVPRNHISEWVNTVRYKNGQIFIINIDKSGIQLNVSKLQDGFLQIFRSIYWKATEVRTILTAFGADKNHNLCISEYYVF